MRKQERFGAIAHSFPQTVVIAGSVRTFSRRARSGWKSRLAITTSAARPPEDGAWVLRLSNAGPGPAACFSPAVKIRQVFDWQRLRCAGLLAHAVVPIGNAGPRHLFSFAGNHEEEAEMPVLLLWAIPAAIIIGGGGYWIMHLH